MMIRQHLSGELMKGRPVFITGRGSGINLGIAKAFAAVGANLAICGRTKFRLDIAATDLRDLGAEVSWPEPEHRPPAGAR